jgi:flagellar protein FliO/FliZ
MVRQVNDGFTTLLTSAGALAGVVGVILLIGWVLRHTSMRKPTSSGQLLVVKDTITLDARRRLYLVQHGDRAVLLLTGGTNDIVVGWLDGMKSP